MESSDLTNSIEHMARLYILTPDQIKTGDRPKTPKEKLKVWKKACIVLSILIILEHIALLIWCKY
jgi:hypothetical protein